MRGQLCVNVGQDYVSSMSVKTDEKQPMADSKLNILRILKLCLPLEARGYG